MKSLEKWGKQPCPVCTHHAPLEITIVMSVTVHWGRDRGERWPLSPSVPSLWWCPLQWLALHLCFLCPGGGFGSLCSPLPWGGMHWGLVLQDTHNFLEICQFLVLAKVRVSYGDYLWEVWWYCSSRVELQVRQGCHRCTTIMVSTVSTRVWEGVAWLCKLATQFSILRKISNCHGHWQCCCWS